MLVTGQSNGTDQIEMVSIDELVPKDHLIRKVSSVMDFTFVYDIVRDKYSKNKGRPSIDPVVLVKMVLIQYLFGIRSMRQTVKEIEVNVAYLVSGFGSERSRAAFHDIREELQAPV